MSKCVCGEAELGSAGTGTWPAPLDLAGSHHRADGPCYRTEDGASLARSPHKADCVCIECEDRRAGRTIEAYDPHAFGRELIAVLELGPYARRITFEAMDQGTLVTVTTEAWLDVSGHDAAEHFALEHLRHYRLVPVEPQEFEAP